VVNQLLGSADANQVTTRAGQIGSAVLGDSSIARIGPEARLVIVPGFGGDYRTLSVSGTASFAVAAGNDLDFEARLGDIAVRSSGGSFAVRDYADENHRMIRAAEGDLNLRFADGSRTLRAGEALYVARDGSAPRAPTEAELAQDFGWLDGRLVLSDVTVEAAAQHFWRWYGLDVSVPDSALAARVLSISVALQSTQAAIAAVEAGANAQFTYVNNRAVFQAARARR
jgi:ferric-dicitrate binding protein FerR (iron transport regulator)